MILAAVAIWLTVVLTSDGKPDPKKRKTKKRNSRKSKRDDFWDYAWS